MKRKLCFGLLLTISSSALIGRELNKSVTQSIIIKTGMVSYEIEGFASKKGTNSTNVAMEYIHHPKKDHGLFFGYRILQAEGTARSEYQAGYCGYRYYPFTLAVPIQSVVNNSSIEYDFSFKPYFETFGSLGRRLIDTKGEAGGLDISSEFYGFGFGTGFQYTPFDYISFDLGLGYEVMNGYGPVLMSGSNIMVQLGILYYI